MQPRSHAVSAHMSPNCFAMAPFCVDSRAYLGVVLRILPTIELIIRVTLAAAFGLHIYMILVLVIVPNPCDLLQCLSLKAASANELHMFSSGSPFLSGCKSF